jgi:hypothetical protein
MASRSPAKPVPRLNRTFGGRFVTATCEICDRHDFGVAIAITKLSATDNFEIERPARIERARHTGSSCLIGVTADRLEVSLDTPQKGPYDLGLPLLGPARLYEPG